MLSENEEFQKLNSRVASLKQQHRELDILISELSQNQNAHVFEIKRLKKKKLLLKDAIAKLESSLIPDLHA